MYRIVDSTLKFSFNEFDETISRKNKRAGDLRIAVECCSVYARENPQVESKYSRFHPVQVAELGGCSQRPHVAHNSHYPAHLFPTFLPLFPLFLPFSFFQYKHRRWRHFSKVTALFHRPLFTLAASLLYPIYVFTYSSLIRTLCLREYQRIDPFIIQISRCCFIFVVILTLPLL